MSSQENNTPTKSSRKIRISLRGADGKQKFPVVPCLITGLTSALVLIASYALWKKFKKPSYKKTTDFSTSNYNLSSGKRFSTANADSVISANTGKTLDQLSLSCNNTPGCIGFDSTGILKSCQDDLVSDANTSVYLRKGTNPAC